MTAIYLIDLAGALVGPITLPMVPGIGCQMPEDAIELDSALAAPEEGFVWALVEGEPVLLADHRGTVYSTATGDAQQLDALGELPEGLTAEPRPSLAHAWTDGNWQVDATLVAKLLKEAQASAWELIKADRDRRTVAGFNVGAVWVHSDLFSRSQWLGLKDNARDALAAGGTLTDGLKDSEGNAIVWKMLGGAFVPVTVQLAFDVVAAVTRSDLAIFTAAETHNVYMRAATDPSAYEYTTGWPQTYAEWAAIQAQEPETIPPEDPAPETDPEQDPEPAPE
jgi:hypothetical protein